MLTLAHNWPPKQKWLILISAGLGLVLLSALIYGYERHYRGPTDAVFLGTWHDTTQMMDSTTYYRFKPDSTFDLIIDGMGSMDVVAVGKWYAGGRNIYMRIPPLQDGTPRRVVYVWHIVDIAPNRILVRDTQRGDPVAWERIQDNLPTASNQAMQLTAGRSGTNF